ncbi:hypothetical protein CTAYLR_004375 [Chrysophaeum taylorii]|uniref:Calmodulin n=1 Tax=Chrysophaeum taylorii TaxID=2483200 RepID=A0AAD7UM17_9STRA|nr:hypothetical protein CTAYLR_004375 [Chrysophaeum taylorii]
MMAAVAIPTVPKISVKLGECAACFEPLAGEPIVMLRQNNRRSCGHYLHARCAQSRPPKGACAVCNQPFTWIEPFPQLNDAQAWFNAIDTDADGRLSMEEVVRALKATVVGLDVERFDAEIASLFVNWDANRDGAVTFDEIFREPYGLLAYARQQYPDLRGASEPPPLSDTWAWFSFWDLDRSNTLDKAEVHRALAKTFDLEKDPTKTHTMGQTLDAVWGLFDLDGNGTIDRNEFTARDGLGDTLAANLSHMRRRAYPQVVLQQRPESAFYATEPQAMPQQPIVASAVDGNAYGDALVAYASPVGSGGGQSQQQYAAVPSAPPTFDDRLPTYLPPNWEERRAPDGQIYYANNLTRHTQWERPRA